MRPQPSFLDSLTRGFPLHCRLSKLKILSHSSSPPPCVHFPFSFYSYYHPFSLSLNHKSILREEYSLLRSVEMCLYYSPPRVIPSLLFPDNGLGPPHLYSLANLLDLSCLAFESTFRFGTLTAFLASRARQASCWRCDQSYVPRQPCHSEELLPVHEPLISPVDRACVHLTLVPLLQVTTLNLSGEASASRFIFQSCHFPKGVLKKCG